MGSISLYGRSGMLDSLLRPDRAPVLTGVWLALTTVVPTSADSGDTIVEPSASSYTRAAFGVGSSFWTAISPGVLSNARAVDWSSADDDWGQVTGWALCTESTSGMTLASGALRRAMTITQGMNPRVSPGSLMLSLQ